MESIVMATFVLVHGAYHGGWCWRDVAKRLISDGHEVFTPTLTGLGERYHLADKTVDLDTHVKDIIGVIDWNDLQDIVLVGHSYGGAVIGCVADQRGDEIKSIVYLDAIIPADGKSVLDFNPPERRKEFFKMADDFNGWQLPPRPAVYYGVTDPAQQKWVDEKCVPHPLKTLTDKPELSGDPHASIDKCGYVLCTNPPLAYMQQFYDWAQPQKKWDCQKLLPGMT